ncbi:hypothetical protein BTS2_3531 [Bacillus sp. TS-2]|nr:hypothetical protein BTS2_3531 [Bacillus sp. TS-2]
MTFILSNSAANLYIKEMTLNKGESLRFFVRIGGVGSGGFSVGVMKEEPSDGALKIEHDKRIFFVEEDDFWYFNEMSIDYDEDLGFLKMEHLKFENIEHPDR